MAYPTDFFMRYTNAKPGTAIKAAIGKAIQLAKADWKNAAYQGEWATGGFGITTIRPYHIQAGAANWGSSDYWASCFAASLTWEAWIDITQTDMAYEIITGFFNLEIAPKTVESYFTAAGKDLPTLNMESMYTLDVSRLYIPQPIVIMPEKPWKYYHKGLNTGVEREGFLGYTLAKHAFLILRA